MELRRRTYGAAIRLALVLSAAAAVMAIVVSTLGEVSAGRLVAGVVIVGFTASWIQTGRVHRAVARQSAHRVTVLPLR